MNNFASSTKKIDIINSTSIAAKCIILFIIGVGRYRSCLFIATYFIIKALSSKRIKNDNYFKFLFIAIGSPLLYLDITKGQILPIYNNHIFIFFLAFSLTELLTKKYANSFIENITDGEEFSYCRQCGFENIELVSTCKECGSKKNVENISTKNALTTKCKDSVENEELFSSMPTKRLLKILKLEDKEEIYLNIRIPFIRGIHKDNIKQLCKNLIVTNLNLTFIDYKFNHRGWFYREQIPASQIKDIGVGQKHVGISDYPLLKIETIDDHKIELFVDTNNLDEETYLELAMSISDIVKKNN